VVTESVVEVYERREEIGGLRFTYEPEELRFFQARFEPITPWRS
jgi:tyrosine phenol-lyase